MGQRELNQSHVNAKTKKKKIEYTIDVICGLSAVRVSPFKTHMYVM